MIGNGCVWGSSSRSKVWACKEDEGYTVYIDVKGVNGRWRVVCVKVYEGDVNVIHSCGGGIHMICNSHQLLRKYMKNTNILQ